MHSKEMLEEFENYKIDTTNEFKELLDNINAIRDKDEGCPWHTSQTHKTLMPYLLEESYEFIEALEKEDKHNMKEELGDLLLQVMLHSNIEYEKEEFSIKDVIHCLNKKIKYRHPHIFQKKEKISKEKAEKIWGQLKQNNHKATNEDSLNSKLISKLKYLEPIKGTELISDEANKYGFAWENYSQILDKINEELGELKEAIENKDEQSIKEEFGDVFFTLVNLSFFLNIKSQETLNQANEKFIKRFAFIEEKLDDKVNKATKNELKRLWELAKKT
tara:strand:+ start:51 stop:875 length:825 start_codon:yes stop_codon:yes gene_type:complete